MKTRILLKFAFSLAVCFIISNNVNSQTSIDFKNFQNSIKNFKNFYQISDTLSSAGGQIESENFIDTIFLQTFKLIDTDSFFADYRPKTLKEYNCSFIGQYKIKNNYLLLTTSIRTEAGDGSPILTVTILSNEGKVLDFYRINIMGIQDPSIQPVTYFYISKTFEINIINTEKDYKEERDGFVLTDSREWKEKYTIDSNGHFSNNLLKQK